MWSHRLRPRERAQPNRRSTWFPPAHAGRRWWARGIASDCGPTLLRQLVISAFVTIPPVLAQSSGVGCDGATRLLWMGNNLSISLWKLDSNLSSLGSVVYGPFDQWIPQGITTACNNNTYVLWLRTDGAVTIWQVDANLN